MYKFSINQNVQCPNPKYRGKVVKQRATRKKGNLYLVSFSATMPVRYVTREYWMKEDELEKTLTTSHWELIKKAIKRFYKNIFK